MTRTCYAGGVEVGRPGTLAIIAGPCVLESMDLALRVGETVRDTCLELGLPYIFKASFDKANRTSFGSARGPGLEAGLEALGAVGERLGVPTTTDVHHPEQCEPAARVVDLLQIPAFLCRQTDLLLAAGEAAARHGRGVNVKKGQFLSPREMRGPVNKLAEAGCQNVMLTERGTFFGYHRLVNDFLGLGDLMELEVEDGPPPVCFDATHSTQLPGAGEQTAGRPDRAPLLARAAVASGVAAIFMECHPDPPSALSDGATQLPLPVARQLLRRLKAIHEATDPDDI
ncbi:MAG: 3-deoxy-8-phosphooctulonate synthase [Phycisphaerales bacterium]|nr:3-deoxy-8-phosphooctulonate synthase [Phycisphaerales bacterium]